MENLSRISLRYLWRVIRLRWRCMTLVTALLFTGAAALICRVHPLYTAEAVVLLAPLGDQLTDSSGSERSAPLTDPFFVRSEAAILSSDELCRGVIEELGLVTAKEFEPHPGLLQRLGVGSPVKQNPFLTPEQVDFDRVLRLYRERLSVFNDGRSKTVVVSFTASDPRLAARVANVHAAAYLREQAARRTDPEQKSIEWLKQEVDSRARDVRDADARVQEYRLRNKIVSARDGTIVEQRLSQLNAQLVEARRDLSGKQAQLAEIRRIRAGANPSDAATILQNDALSDLLRNRAQAEAALTALQSRLAPTHPALIKQRQELAGIGEVVEKQLRRVESDSESAARTSQRQVDDLESAVKDETTHKENEDRVTAVLPALVAEAGVKHTVFETVLSRYQTRLAEHAFAEPTAAIVSQAQPPARPSFPKTALLLTIATLGALMGGVAAAALMQMCQPIPRGLNEVADAIGIRPLVAIPRFRNTAPVKGAIKIDDPRLFVESIRSVRNAIFEQQGAQPTKICLITSILPGQGKSLVAMSLARALARSGVKTLFMEMDLRRPSASLLARVSTPVVAIGAVLEGRARPEDVTIRDEASGLDMLLAEQHACNSLDRLTVLTSAHVLGELRARYDAIIVDSPPIGVVSDALILASLADQTVLVAKEGNTSTDELAAGTRLLKDRGARVAGLILTNVNPAGLSSVDRTTLDKYVRGVPRTVELLSDHRMKRAS